MVVVENNRNVLVAVVKENDRNVVVVAEVEKNNIEMWRCWCWRRKTVEIWWWWWRWWRKTTEMWWWWWKKAIEMCGCGGRRKQ